MVRLGTYFKEKIWEIFRIVQELLRSEFEDVDGENDWESRIARGELHTMRPKDKKTKQPIGDVFRHFRNCLDGDLDISLLLNFIIRATQFVSNPPRGGRRSTLLNIPPEIWTNVCHVGLLKTIRNKTEHPSVSGDMTSLECLTALTALENLLLIFLKGNSYFVKKEDVLTRRNQQNQGARRRRDQTVSWLRRKREEFKKICGDVNSFIDKFFERGRGIQVIHGHSLVKEFDVKQIEKDMDELERKFAKEREKMKEDMDKIINERNLLGKERELLLENVGRLEKKLDDVEFGHMNIQKIDSLEERIQTLELDLKKMDEENESLRSQLLGKRKRDSASVFEDEPEKKIQKIEKKCESSTCDRILGENENNFECPIFTVDECLMHLCKGCVRFGFCRECYSDIFEKANQVCTMEMIPEVFSPDYLDNKWF